MTKHPAGRQDVSSVPGFCALCFLPDPGSFNGAAPCNGQARPPRPMCKDPREAEEDIEISLAALERRFPVIGKRASPNQNQDAFGGS